MELVNKAVRGWEFANYKVVGAAPTASAAEVLKRETGMKTGTLHGLLGIFPNGKQGNLKRRKGQAGECSVNGEKVTPSNRPAPTKNPEPARMWNEPLDQNTVVVVDEASLINTDLMHQLLERIETTGATLLLLGDDRQKQSVERGGAFKALLKRFDHSELNEIVRQTTAWGREVIEHASNHEAGKALKGLAMQEAIWVGQNREETIKALVEQAVRERDRYGINIVIANRNVEVDAINLRYQLLYQEPMKYPERLNVKIFDKGRGYYGGQERVWVGDQVVVTKNQFVGLQGSKTYVTNGTIGTVADIHQDGQIRISLLDKDICIAPEEFRHLRLAYAISSYKAQGKTFDSVFALLGEHTRDMADFYVQISRFKKDIKVFVDAATLGGKLSTIEDSALAKRLEEHEQVELAIESYLAMLYPDQLVESKLRSEKPASLQEEPAVLQTIEQPIVAGIEPDSTDNEMPFQFDSDSMISEPAAASGVIAKPPLETKEPVFLAEDFVLDATSKSNSVQKEKRRSNSRIKKYPPPVPQEIEPLVVDREQLADTTGLHVAQATELSHLSVMSMLQVTAMSVWCKIQSAAEYVLRNLLRPSWDLFWAITFFPASLWKRFLAIEEQRLIPMRLAYWRHQNRDKTLLERVGEKFKYLFSKSHVDGHRKLYKKSAEEQGFRFLFFLVGQITSPILWLTKQSKQAASGIVLKAWGATKSISWKLAAAVRFSFLTSCQITTFVGRKIGSGISLVANSTTALAIILGSLIKSIGYGTVVSIQYICQKLAKGAVLSLQGFNRIVAVTGKGLWQLASFITGVIIISIITLLVLLAALVGAIACGSWSVVQAISRKLGFFRDFSG